MKGIVENMLAGLHIEDYRLERGTHSSFHPGRSADLLIRRERIGAFGEIHPQVAARFKLTEAKVIYAELQVAPLIQQHQRLHAITPLPDDACRPGRHRPDRQRGFAGRRG